MKNSIVVLISSVILASLTGLAVAQQNLPDSSASLKVPGDLNQPAQPTIPESGLKVEELRFKDRLGSVTVEHEGSGVTEYYDLNRTDEIYQDGGMTEQSPMRTWRLGGGSKK